MSPRAEEAPLAFHTCWQRIERADVHRTAFAKAWNEFIEGDEAYNTVLHVESDGTGSLNVYPAAPIPEILSIELGEALYQFRAGLDALIYQAAILETKQNPPPSERNLEFPICATRAAFDKSAYKIAPLPQKLRNLVESVQPYNTPQLSPEELPLNFNRTLAILNDWARKDRHRQLHIVTSWISRIAPMFRVPVGVTIENLFIRSDGRLSRDHEIATFTLRGWVDGMKVQGNPNLAIDAAVDEPPPPCSDRDTLSNRCLCMNIAIGTLIRSFEGYFRGEW